MTSGLGGLGYTDDAVAAKLSLDLPHDSEDQLKHIAQFSSEVRVNMEATARFTGEYMSYIQSFPTIQRQVNDLQREQLQILRDTASALDSIRSQGGVGFQGQPGQGQRYSEAGRALPGDYYLPNGTRLPPGYERFHPEARPGSNGHSNNPNATPSEQNHAHRQDEIERQNEIRERAIERERERLRREARSARRDGDDDLPGPRGRRPRPDDDESPDEDTRQGGGLLDRLIRQRSQNALNPVDEAVRAMGPGGTLAGRLAAISRLLGQAPDEEGNGGTGAASALRRLAPYAKGVGIAGATIGGAMLANNVVQNTGEMIQSTRNLDLNEHSFAGGMGVQKDVMLMAMNPLLTNEQSREIIMGAMKSGYTGESYESAVDFIKKNLIDMNMEVGKSVQLLKSNVALGGQSVGSLNYALSTNQALAGVGPKTTDQIQESFMRNNDQFMSVGVNASAAAGAATFANAMFNSTWTAPDGTQQPNPMGQDGNWDKIIAAVTTNDAFTGLIWNKYVPTAGFSDTWDAVGANANQYIWEILKEIANTTGSFTNFKYTVSVYGIPQALGNDTALRSLYEQLIGKSDPVKAGKEQLAGVSTPMVNGQQAVGMKTFDQWKQQAGNESKSRSDYNAEITGSSGTTPRVDSDVLGRIANANPKAIIVDDSGNGHLIDPNNLEQNIGLANGTWKIVDNVLSNETHRSDDGSLEHGGGGRVGRGKDKNENLAAELSGQDFSRAAATTAGNGWDINSIRSGAPGVSGVNDGTQSGSVDMGGNHTSRSGAGGSFGLTPEAAKLFQFLPWPGSVPMGQTVDDANAGKNGAQKNDGSGGGN